jgi:type I restriction enzyme S subunit
MLDLKPGWRRVRFGDVVRQVKEKVNPETAGLARFIAGEHMETDDLKIRSWGNIGQGYLGPAFNTRFRPGHVLYGSRRTYLRKVALADFEGICANTTFVLEPIDSNVLVPSLLPFIMQSEAFHAHSKRESKGSVNPYVNFSDLAWYEFLLPPREEQQQIASVLAAVERAVDSSRQLVTQASVLLSSTIDELVCSAFAAGGAIDLNELIEDGRPITYGILKPGSTHPGGVPVIKVRDFPNGEVLMDDLLLTDPKIDAEYRRSRLRSGDLLISIRGTIGRLAFVPPALHGANITQDTARLAIREEVNSLFVRAVLESSKLKAQMKSLSTGLAVQGLNIGELRRLRVPFVSGAEQDRIADAVQDARETEKLTSSRLSETINLKKIALANCLP